MAGLVVVCLLILVNEKAHKPEQLVSAVSCRLVRMKTCRHFHDTKPPLRPNWARPLLPPFRNGQACGQHPTRGAEPAAGRRCGRLPQHPAHPACAAHHPPADARGLHVGGTARPHAVVPATAHRQPVRAQNIAGGQTCWVVFLCWDFRCSNIIKIWCRSFSKKKRSKNKLRHLEVKKKRSWCGFVSFESSTLVCVCESVCARRFRAAF